jgi:hypothetical protein
VPQRRRQTQQQRLVVAGCSLALHSLGVGEAQETLHVTGRKDAAGPAVRLLYDDLQLCG